MRALVKAHAERGMWMQDVQQLDAKYDAKPDNLIKY